jgi:hypothetical protein
MNCPTRTCSGTMRANGMQYPGRRVIVRKCDECGRVEEKRHDGRKDKRP